MPLGASGGGRQKGATRHSPAGSAGRPKKETRRKDRFLATGVVYQLVYQESSRLSNFFRRPQKIGRFIDLKHLGKGFQRI